MAFPVNGIIDNFNRSNEGPPLSSNWTTIDNGLKVETNAAKGTNGSGTNWENWNVETFGPNCECYATMTNHLALTVYARLTSVDTDDDGYSIYSYNDEVVILRRDNGATTELGARIDQVDADGDKLGIEIVGSTITAYFNDGGAGWGSLGTRSDATYGNAGYIGISEYGVNIIDDFGGGTIEAVGIAPTGVLYGPLVGPLGGPI